MTRSEILKKYEACMDNMLLILHDIQNNSLQNYISEEDIKEVSKFLNTSYSSVYGVITYYSMFSHKPRGSNLIRVCNSPVCNLQNSEEIIDKLKETLKVEIGQTSSDGKFTLETCECLGMCSASPVAMINKDYHGVLSADRVKKVLQKYN